ncbi:TPA: tRNA dihydrouridine(20/20a) synthase DusA [Legionella pneumophila]|nr:tRNA dihydrouridine(20/20a) synthase DusA [Legionella pneumophila]HDU8069396.1 tRNA dihydrouridine(20/20a) synthase DusA [Legionella pneumophila]HDZ9662711.1 tRNA dihydrouridine(20/20a) synthase DusA [Legionella pneumophila]HEL8472238.1 tRNA dihydrouridine(20/20a) synthase DusA [Legionella pneumophila]HEL9678145.1 tRNA dihydrouridine(20/20a) synthase DusA [Legionella pneumophila]
MVNSIFSKLSIAPMIDWTNSPFRTLMRLLAPNALLYTEMQTTGAVQNNPDRALYFNSVEHPIAIQLGGADKSALVKCAIIAEQKGFNEINLNLGCPSDKVQAGRFGACLMKEPEHVADCIRAIKQVVGIPVTAKTRIGIDNQDSYEFFRSFSLHLVEAGCDKLIVHARKAWLNGLNPKQNRTIPPVNYDYVYELKKEIPHIFITINGNILTIEEINSHLTHVDGVMLGRLACDNPYQIAEIHQALYPEFIKIKRSQLLMNYLDYWFDQSRANLSLSILVKPLFNLAFGLPGAKHWKKKLMNIIQEKDTSGFSELIQYLLNLEAINQVEFV